MDKCYRVVYTNKDGEKLAGMWKDKESAVAELEGYYFDVHGPAMVYNELDLTLDVLYKIKRAKIEEL